MESIGVIGLGRMGQAIAYRLQQAGYNVIGFDQNNDIRRTAQQSGISCVDDARDIAKQARIVWLMVPAGDAVDDVLARIDGVLKQADIVIDGGNSFFKDTLRRYQKLTTQGIAYLDCGTSGGLYGKERGFSLMVGGDKVVFEKAIPIFKAIAAESGYAYIGPSGSGHFVKMVHNGIEYGMMQAMAEGFHLLHEGPFKDLDLEAIAAVWNHGAIVRSWLLELVQEIMSRGQELENISGAVGENLTGQWMVKTAKEQGIPVNVIEQAVSVRSWSRQTGGNYGTKLVAMLRHQFGGHEIKKNK